MPDPSVKRKYGGRRLRRKREELGSTQHQVVAALDWSLSKLQRVEAGSHGVSTTDLRSLLDHYGVIGADREPYLDDFRAGRERSWYVPFRPVLSPQVIRLFGYESIATAVRQVNPLHIPGQLQTLAYAHEQLAPYFAGDELAAAIRARELRQQLLWGADRPDLSVVLDEGVIRRLIGGPDVMREQLQHLLRVADEPRASVRVVPFGAGWHYGLEGAFTLLDVAAVQSRPETVLYQEQGERDYFTEDDPGLLADYERKWTALCAVALSEGRSADLIAAQVRLLEESR
ncbi:helix-turn-helix domain-containing protein [Actinokineospora diospyrosa]|uniref:Helix-turn-helix domain-containing protein n=1 Tax=Actinokineospora diospyrosa TaxID=103728 RepID=A0ABT1I941_9PSEU|nr:helix-turn-helix transcriptional regulator [Actinokineospora diospyrosa]MCP2269088.1 Helix-turn-helix domain-containing protein [Actinokineospora diospyrosa]